MVWLDAVNGMSAVDDAGFEKLLLTIGRLDAAQRQGALRVLALVAAEKRSIRSPGRRWPGCTAGTADMLRCQALTAGETVSQAATRCDVAYTRAFRWRPPARQNPTRRFHGSATVNLPSYVGWRSTIEALVNKSTPDGWIMAAAGLGPYQQCST